jgi:hypothetical protein
MRMGIILQPIQISLLCHIKDSSYQTGSQHMHGRQNMYKIFIVLCVKIEVYLLLCSSLHEVSKRVLRSGGGE